MLEARHIAKRFGEGDNKVQALKDVSFSVNYGEMLYIVGPSGSGKTTLLSIISGILRPTEGEVLIDDQNIWQFGDDELTRFRSNYIGFVFQDFHLFPRLTIEENVAIPLILQNKSWDFSIEQAKKYLEIVHLSHRIHLTPRKISIGEQQRVAIARAMITQPNFLVLDEPTASLDGETGKRIITFIKSQVLNEKRAIIVVTHDNRIYEFASRIISMEDGQITDKVPT